DALALELAARVTEQLLRPRAEERDAPVPIDEKERRRCDLQRRAKEVGVRALRRGLTCGLDEPSRGLRVCHPVSRGRSYCRRAPASRRGTSADEKKRSARGPGGSHGHPARRTTGESRLAADTDASDAPHRRAPARHARA